MTIFHVIKYPVDTRYQEKGYSNEVYNIKKDLPVVWEEWNKKITMSSPYADDINLLRKILLEYEGPL